MDETTDEVRSGAKQMVRGEACASCTAGFHGTLCVKDRSSFVHILRLKGMQWSLLVSRLWF